MGRNKDGRRPLTADEEARAHKLMETYVWLAEAVARKCRRRLAAERDDYWRPIPFDVALENAYLGLCEGARVYVERGHDLPEPEERAYLAKCIENALRDYARKEWHLSEAKEEAETESGAKETVTHNIVSLELIARRHLALDEEYEEADEDKFLMREARVDETLSLLPIDDAFKMFAASLPLEERVAFEELTRHNETGPHRSFEEIAMAVGKRLGREQGVNVRYLFDVRRSAAKKLFAWIDEEYGRAA